MLDNHTTEHHVNGIKPMQAALQINQLEEHYNEITDLYDLADELIATVESDFVHDPQAQLDIVEPLTYELESATDILVDEYMNIVENNITRKKNGKVEGALRRVYTAIDAYYKQTQETVKDAGSGFRNLADPIVKRLLRQMETVVAALIDFVDLSLGRIMSHSHAELLRQRQEKIALMLHSMGQSAN